MTPEERALIDGLFERIRSVEGQQQDPEAQDLIARRVAESPVAAYALVQSVLVQDHALQQAMTRVQELESRLEQAEDRIRAAEERAQDAAQQPAAGGFLGGLLGGGRSSVPSAGARAPTSGSARATPPLGTPPGFGQRAAAEAQRQASGPWGQNGAQQGGQPYAQQQPQRGGMMGSGGGGFMQNALATAAGVAGGALLFSGIQSMLSGGEGPVAQQAAAENGAADSAATADASAADMGSADATPAVDHAMDDGGWNAAPQEASHEGGGWDDSSQWDDGGFDDGGFDDGGWA
ncbi:MAG: DUF2076 family protein [Xanthobacter sp.]